MKIAIGFLVRMGCAALLIVSIVNCGKSSDGRTNVALSTPPVFPREVLPVFSKIVLRTWGTYPGPDGSSGLTLAIEKVSASHVTAVYSRGPCVVEQELEPVDFAKLLNLVQASSTKPGQGASAVDMGSTTLSLIPEDPAAAIPAPIHLSEDETSRGERIFVDPDELNTLVYEIVEDLSVLCRSNPVR